MHLHTSTGVYSHIVSPTQEGKLQRPPAPSHPQSPPALLNCHSAARRTAASRLRSTSPSLGSSWMPATRIAVRVQYTPGPGSRLNAPRRGNRLRLRGRHRIRRGAVITEHDVLPPPTVREHLTGFGRRRTVVTDALALSTVPQEGVRHDVDKWRIPRRPRGRGSIRRVDVRGASMESQVPAVGRDLDTV